jgi:carbamoyl-phosphate synthase large subunit
VQDGKNPENMVDEAYVVPRTDSPEYIPKLNELIDRTGAELMHPQPDGDVKLFSDNRERLACPVFLPRKTTVDICQDKYLSGKAWQAAGLPLIETLYVTSATSDLERAAGVFGYPYWVRASQGASSRGSTPVHNLETAQSWISYWEARNVGWKFIAQAYLPGAVIAFQSLWRNGELITSAARERVEYLYPSLAPSGVTNTPVVAKTIHRDDVNEMAVKAVRSIDAEATGVFCVDLRENERGVPVPTEINCGRFFTTSYFFTEAGVNMPYYYVRMAFGESLPTLTPFNAIPENWYWCRHIDCPGVLVKGLD